MGAIQIVAFLPPHGSQRAEKATIWFCARGDGRVSIKTGERQVSSHYAFYPASVFTYQHCSSNLPCTCVRAAPFVRTLLMIFGYGLRIVFSDS